MSDKPSILIVGAGAIGSFYGAILKQAGCPVSVVMRSEYDAVKANGIRINSPLGDLSYQPDAVYREGDTPEQAPDYLILCVKVLPGVDRASLVRPWMGPQTRLVLIENGLDIERELADAYPQNRPSLPPAAPARGKWSTRPTANSSWGASRKAWTRTAKPWLSCSARAASASI